jgi:hypothetical protein
LTGWRPGDKRWRVHVIDMSTLPVKEVAAKLIEWIDTERTLFRSGAHPLGNAAAYDPSGY